MGRVVRLHMYFYLYFFIWASYTGQFKHGAHQGILFFQCGQFRGSYSSDEMSFHTNFENLKKSEFASRDKYLESSVKEHSAVKDQVYPLIVTLMGNTLLVECSLHLFDEITSNVLICTLYPSKDDSTAFCVVFFCCFFLIICAEKILVEIKKLLVHDTLHKLLF